MIDQTQQLTIGLIGAGKVGTKLLELFTQSLHTRVAFIADTNPTSPGILQGKKLGIPIFSSADDALESNPVKYVFEVTGSEKVAESLKKRLKDTEIQLVTHEMAFILIASLEEKEQRMCAQVTTEINAIKSEIAKSLSNVKKLVEQLEDIAQDMRLLALNARIEAARIGDQGRSFGVVAEQMTRSVDDIRGTTVEIETLNSDILQVSNQIDDALKRLDQR